MEFAGFFLGVVEVMMRGFGVGHRSTTDDAGLEKRASLSLSHSRRSAPGLNFAILILICAGVCCAGKSAIVGQNNGYSVIDLGIPDNSDFDWSQVRHILPFSPRC